MIDLNNIPFPECALVYSYHRHTQSQLVSQAEVIDIILK